jgi:hypothetical protein
LKEAAKLGFLAAVAPPAAGESVDRSAISVSSCAHIAALVADIAAEGAQARRPHVVRDHARQVVAAAN